MKVLIVAEQLRQRVPGGIGTYVTGLCLGLVNEDIIMPTLVASGTKDNLPDPLEEFGYPIVRMRYRTRVLSRLWGFGLAGPKGKWSAVHATSLLMPPSRAPLTVMVHDMAWRRYPEAYPASGRAWHERALRRAIVHARHFFVPSLETKNDLVGDGVLPSQITVTNLGYDHLPEPDDEGASTLLARIKVTDSFLLAVGTFEPRKNLARLVAGYELVRSEIGKMPLVVVGPTGWGAALKPIEGVHIVRSASAAQITSLYRRCNTFVSVPLMEGFGLPILEAMSQGAPVVSSSTPSSGDATYRVDPMNPAAIGEGIRRVVTEPAMRRDLIAKGRRHAEGMTWANCARQHAQVWEGLR